MSCKHGASVGPVDPETRFYLESRGIATPEAERLIVEGFLADVLAKFDADVDSPLSRFLAGHVERVWRSHEDRT